MMDEIQVSAGNAIFRWQDFNDFGQRLLRSIKNSIAPAIEQLSSGQVQHAIDQFVRGDSEKGLGAAGITDGEILQDAPQWPVLLQDLLSGGGIKAFEIDF